MPHTHNKPSRPTVAPAPATSVDSLARRLVDQARKEVRNSAASRPPDGAPTSREVLFETRVDDVRCVIFREEAPCGDAIVLSPREREIARLVASGYPNKTIGSILEISPWTVGTHLRRMFTKTSASSRAAMVARLMEAGVLERSGAGSPPNGKTHLSGGP